MSEELLAVDGGKESLARWLGFKGRWKKEKAPKPPKERQPRTWNLPKFTLPLTVIYTAKAAYTHRYSEARVTKGLSDIEKAAVLAGALLVYDTGIKVNGTTFRKVIRYRGRTFMPRKLTKTELEHLNKQTMIVKLDPKLK